MKDTWEEKYFLLLLSVLYPLFIRTISCTCCYELGSCSCLQPANSDPPKEVQQPTSRAWKKLLDKETPDITVSYDLREVLGKGNYGTTRIAVDKKTKRRYACKSISKRKLTCQEDVDDVKREIELLHHLGGHSNVIGFKGAFEDRTKIHLVMELCTGGELFDR